MIQQGDVVIVKCCGVRGKKLKHLTLAFGEATGHHHTITKGDAELYEQNGTLYLKVNSDSAELTHQEHDVVEIPQGEYQINIVKEFDHFKEEAKRVVD